MSYLSSWTSGLDKENAREIELMLKNSERVFERLTYIFDQKMKASIKKQGSNSAYDKAAWPMFQADAIGYQRAINELKEILTKRD